MSEFVKDSFLLLIDMSLTFVESFRFDQLLDDFLRLYVPAPPELEELLATDKFYIYRSFWKSILELLYNKYLPSYQYHFDWEIEVSPYTLSVCDLAKERSSDREIALVKRLLRLTDAEIEDQYQDVLDKIGVPSLGFPNGIEGLVGSENVPQKRIDQLALLFRLMNFPPLEEFAVFFKNYGEHINREIRELSGIFPGMDIAKNLKFSFQGAIGATYFCIDHATFKRRGLNGIEADLANSAFSQDFDTIRKDAAAFAEGLKDITVCPCCGNTQEISVPEEVAQFLLLINNRRLTKAASLLYVNDFMAAQKERVTEAIFSVVKEINQVDKPDCLILVEGESEEHSIPLLALKSGLFLSKGNVKVYNAKSKQKLEAEFMSYREKFPLMKMICLLDSDAKKEAENISRLIKGNRHKYHLVFIKKGCFEELFDISKSVEILNRLYPDGDEIFLADFDSRKDFGANIAKILHEKKKAKFDKVRFAKAISSSLGVGEIPAEIRELLEVAKKFSIKQKFFSDRDAS